MSALRRLIDTLGALIGRRRLEAELDEEIQYHLDRETAKLEADGVAPDEARRQARLAFGGVVASKQGVREARGLGTGLTSVTHGLRTDLVQAIRGLRRAPRFSLSVILLLGLSLGVGTTLFSVVDHLLLRPPAHVQDPDRVVRLIGQATRADGTPFHLTSRSWIDFESQRDHATATTDHAAWWTTQMSLGRGAEARSIQVNLITPSFFRLLGVRPALGRFFTNEEDMRDAASGPAVIGHEFWRAFLGGRADVLGQTLLIGTVSYTIVGVAPAGFGGLGVSLVDAWLPIQIAAGDNMGRHPELWSTDGSHWLQLAARLKPGISRTAAAEDATRAYRSFTSRQRDPELTQSMLADPLIAGRGSQPARSAQVAAWLGYGVVGLMLLVVANLVNLFLARNLTRGRETAVRLALGGSRTRIFQFLVVESLLLAVVAGGAGLLLVGWLGPIARATLLPDTTWASQALDLRVAGAGVGVAALVGMLVAAIMTLQAGGLAPADAFRRGGTHQMAGGRAGQRIRLLLVGVQAALSTALLIASLGFVQSLRRAMSTELGMHIEEVLVAEAPLSIAGFDRPRQWAYYEALHEALSRTPGVASASLGYMNPWSNNRSEAIRLPGRDSVPMEPSFGAPAFDVVTPDYLATLGMRLISGRWVEPADREGAPAVVVVNQALATLYWPGESPLGQCTYIGGNSTVCRTVIGIVADHRFTGRLDGPPIAAYFLPLAQARAYNVVPRLFVRTIGDPEQFQAGLRRLLQSAAPDLPAAQVRTLRGQVDVLLASWRLGAYAFSGFGVLATIVAMAGLFGVLAYLVTARSAEFAIRSALGAQPRQIAVPVVVQGVLVVGAGILVGLGLASYLGRWLQPMLFQTRLTEPAVMAGVAVLLLVVAIAASAGPARRAGGKDPMQVLRG